MVNEIGADSDSSAVRRGDVAVMVGILSEANGRTAKSSLECKCKISRVRLQVYVDVLHDMGLLTVDSMSDCPRATEKGHKFLDEYETIREMTV